MSTIIKRILPLITAIAIFSCNAQQDNSPFADILSNPPYSTISDSIKKEPKRDDLYFRRAVLLNKNNLPEPALADFRQAWSINPEERYAAGISNILLEKRPDSAAIFLQTAVKDLPQSIYLQLMLARAYGAQNKIDEAIAACDKVLSIDSTQVNTIIYKSELAQQKGDNNTATVLLEKAVRLMPENLELSNRLAYQYAETKNPKAIGFSDLLIKNDSLQLHAEPYYVKGVYYTNVSDRAKAIEQFDLAIRHDHRMLNAYIEKGKIQLDQKKTADALKTFQLANTIAPAFPDAWYWIGRCQLVMGLKQDAKLNFEKAYGLDKTFTDAKEAADSIK